MMHWRSSASRSSSPPLYCPPSRVRRHDMMTGLGLAPSNSPKSAAFSKRSRRTSRRSHCREALSMSASASRRDSCAIEMQIMAVPGGRGCGIPPSVADAAPGRNFNIRMDATIELRRFLVLTALMFWQGGFVFYSAVVVPIGGQIYGPIEQGFVTRQVTTYLNLSGAVGLVLLGLDVLLTGDPFRPRRWVRWWTWLGMVLALVLL